jgi:hypothetical protein
MMKRKGEKMIGQAKQSYFVNEAAHLDPLFPLYLNMMSELQCKSKIKN